MMEEWKHNQREGKGILKKNNGDEYNGNWIKDNFIKGEIKYFNGEIYKGESNNDMRNGYGKMKYNTDDIYEGYWKNDIKEGNGKLIYKNG